MTDRLPAGRCGDFFRVAVGWSDATRHGGALSGRLFRLVREVLYPRTTERLQRARADEVGVDELCALVAADRASDEHAAVLGDPSFHRPDEHAVAPRTLHVTSTLSGDTARVPLAGLYAHDVAAALRGHDGGPALLQRMVEEAASSLVNEYAIRVNGGPARSRVEGAHPLFVGHACVTWASGDLRLWSDPFLPPKSPHYPRRYQPLGPLDFPERAHAVLLTHSHPDHFDPGSLMLFPADTQFFIPEIRHESSLSLNLRLRLQQLGFSRIEALPWWGARRVGPFEVVALPFYGEQPLGWGGAPLAEYNRGNTYAVRTPGGRLDVLLADSGPDPRCSVEQHARALRRELGRVDTLFANHRRWRLMPPQYLLTSVPQYLCHVPAEEMGIQQQIMMGPEQTAAFAEAVGARHVVPYAMGGARWHEEVGLGYDHLAPRRSTDFDANPHDLATVVEDQGNRLRRSFRPVVLAAGQSLVDDRAALAEGLRLPGPGDYRRRAPQRPLACIAVVGPAVQAETIGHLASLTTLDPAAFIIASPGFCEVYTSAGKPGELLRVMLARYLEHVDAVVTRRVRAWTAAPFSGSPGWASRFTRAHAAAFAGLRDGEDVVEVLRRVCGGLGRAPRALTTVLERELLGGAGSRPTRVRKGGGLLAGVPRAAPLIRRYGETTVLRGLLITKLIHNIVQTARAMGRGERLADEPAVYAAVLGAAE